MCVFVFSCQVFVESCHIEVESDISQHLDIAIKEHDSIHEDQDGNTESSRKWISDTFAKY